MARQAASARVMLNLRVERTVKDRLLAAAFHDLSNSQGVKSPDDVNLSEFLREDVLKPWLDAYEREAGGREVLAEGFSIAKLEALEQSVTKLRESLLPGDESVDLNV